jgi:hypothetical protein
MNPPAIDDFRSFNPPRVFGGHFPSHIGRLVIGRERSLCQITKCSQFEYTFCRRKLRAVKPTSAPNAKSQLQAVDATACTKKISQVAAVAQTSAVRGHPSLAGVSLPPRGIKLPRSRPLGIVVA